MNYKEQLSKYLEKKSNNNKSLTNSKIDDSLVYSISENTSKCNITMLSLTKKEEDDINKNLGLDINKYKNLLQDCMTFNNVRKDGVWISSIRITILRVIYHLMILKL